MKRKSSYGLREADFGLQGGEFYGDDESDVEERSVRIGRHSVVLVRNQWGLVTAWVRGIGNVASGYEEREVIEEARERLSRLVPNTSSAPKVRLTSAGRFNGGIATKRRWGSATITLFYVQVDGVLQNGQWEGYGATPGERMTYAKESFLAGKPPSRYRF